MLLIPFDVEGMSAPLPDHIDAEDHNVQGPIQARPRLVEIVVDTWDDLAAPWGRCNVTSGCISVPLRRRNPPGTHETSSSYKLITINNYSVPSSILEFLNASRYHSTVRTLLYIIALRTATLIAAVRLDTKVRSVTPDQPTHKEYPALKSLLFRKNVYGGTNAL